jgi:hypothetical protein
MVAKVCLADRLCSFKQSFSYVTFTIFYSSKFAQDTFIAGFSCPSMPMPQGVQWQHMKTA